MSFERFRPRQKPVATDTDTWFGGGMAGGWMLSVRGTG